MTNDLFSGQHTGVAPMALHAYENAVHGLLSHRPTASAALDTALSLQPDFVSAHALRAFGGVSLARPETIAAARSAAKEARAASGANATQGEMVLVAAAEDAVMGRLLRAADRFDAHVAEHPHDLLAIKLSHGLRFMSGDASGMLRTTQEALPRWSAATPGYGFLLGCHAFGLEEAGAFAEAELTGLRALENEPADAWGAHAVGHVYEMTGQTGRGIAWLEETRQVWQGCNNFGFHMAWHLALCHMSRGRHDLALELYDRHVRAERSEDFRDVANAVSLLWRLRQEGVEVGARWNELAAIARRRANESSLVFASLHYLLAALAVDDRPTSHAILATLRQSARQDETDQDEIARTTGAALAAALIGSTAGSVCISELDRLGGSRAQRDVFIRTLAHCAANAGDAEAAGRLLQARRRTRPDAFETRTRARASGIPMLEVA